MALDADSPDTDTTATADTSYGKGSPRRKAATATSIVKARAALVAKYGPDIYRIRGRNGARTTMERYGDLGYYQLLGTLGGIASGESKRAKKAEKAARSSTDS